MKVLLRRVTSGLYYKTEKDWTEHAEQARDFTSLEEAILPAPRNWLTWKPSFPSPAANTRC